MWQGHSRPVTPPLPLSFPSLPLPYPPYPFPTPTPTPESPPSHHKPLVSPYPPRPPQPLARHNRLSQQSPTTTTHPRTSL